MEMIIVAASLAAVPALAFVLRQLFKRSRSINREQRAAGRLETFAAANNLRFSCSERLQAGALLALDEIYGKLVYTGTAGQTSENDFILVSLSDVRHCSVRKVHRSVYTPRKKSRAWRYVDRVLLRFEFIDHRTALELPFYNSRKAWPGETADSFAMYELALDWQSRIARISARSSRLAAL